MAQILTKVSDPQAVVLGLAEQAESPAFLRRHIEGTNAVVGSSLREAVAPLSRRTAMLGASLEAALVSKRDYDRAWFVRLGFESFSEDWLRAKHALTAAELSYASIVILDDMVDQGVTRYGGPCLYRAVGFDRALYLAEILRSLSAMELHRALDEATLDLTRRSEVLMRQERTLCDINYGQYWDVAASGGDPAVFTDSDYLELIHFTTGVDISNCLATGAILAGSPPESLPPLERIGELMGTIMQIRDDLLDYAPIAEDIDKSPGRDFARLRMKLPYLVAYRHGVAADRAFLNAAASGETAPKWEDVRRQVLSASTVSYILDMMRVLVAELNRVIATAPVRPSCRDFLLAFSHGLASEV